MYHSVVHCLVSKWTGNDVVDNTGDVLDSWQPSRVLAEADITNICLAAAIRALVAACTSSFA